MLFSAEEKKRILEETDRTWPPARWTANAGSTRRLRSWGLAGNIDRVLPITPLHQRHTVIARYSTRWLTYIPLRQRHTANAGYRTCSLTYAILYWLMLAFVELHYFRSEKRTPRQ